MSLQLIIFEVSLFTVTAMAVMLARIAWIHRPIKGTTVFSGLMASAGLWALFYALEIASASMQAKILWAKLQYIGIVTIPYVWIIFALQYSQPPKIKTLPKLVTWGLLIEPLLTLIFVFTNENHSLVWQEIQWGIIGDQKTAVFIKGIWYWVNVGYSYLLLLIGAIFIILLLLRSLRNSKAQAASLLIVVAAPWLGNLLYITGVSPLPHLDFTPFGFVIAGIALILGVYKFDLFNIVPVGFCG